MQRFLRQYGMPLLQSCPNICTLIIYDYRVIGTLLQAYSLLVQGLPSRHHKRV